MIFRNRLDHETGAFAEYVIAKAAIQMKIPDNVSFEQAATMGVSIITCVGRSWYTHDGALTNLLAGARTLQIAQASTTRIPCC